MFQLDQIRTQLAKYPNDPECANLLAELNEHYGYNVKDSDVQDTLDKVRTQVQGLLTIKDPVKRQTGLIEITQDIKRFLLAINQNPNLTEEEKHSFSKQTTDIQHEAVTAVLGVDIKTLVK